MFKYTGTLQNVKKEEQKSDSHKNFHKIYFGVGVLTSWRMKK